MTSTRTALDADWLGVCRRAVDGIQRLLEQTPLTEDRARETGTRGSGGDRTLVIDSVAESIVVVAELERDRGRGIPLLRASPRSGARSTTATRSVRVIIDPIDGSLNAKRDALPLRALDRGRRR